MRTTLDALIVAVVACILLAAPTSAQVDPVEVEFDEFWAEASRTASGTTQAAPRRRGRLV